MLNWATNCTEFLLACCRPLHSFRLKFLANQESCFAKRETSIVKLVLVDFKALFFLAALMATNGGYIDFFFSSSRSRGRRKCNFWHLGYLPTQFWARKKLPNKRKTWQKPTVLVLNIKKCSDVMFWRTHTVVLKNNPHENVPRNMEMYI